MDDLTYIIEINYKNEESLNNLCTFTEFGKILYESNYMSYANEDTVLFMYIRFKTPAKLTHFLNLLSELQSTINMINSKGRIIEIYNIKFELKNIKYNVEIFSYHLTTTRNYLNVITKFYLNMLLTLHNKEETKRYCFEKVNFLIKNKLSIFRNGDTITRLNEIYNQLGITKYKYDFIE